MKTFLAWNEEPEIFEQVVDALEGNFTHVEVSRDVGQYGERGYIRISDKNGRTFSVDLWEIESRPFVRSVAAR